MNVLERTSAAAMVFITASTSPAWATTPSAYTAHEVTFATNNELLNPDVATFNNLSQYTMRLFVPDPDSGPALRQTSLVTGEPDAAVQTPIAPLGSDLSNRSLGLNDPGDVVGTSFVENVSPNFSQRDAFYLPFGGSVVQLPTIDHGAQALDINNSKTIVGHSFTDADGFNQVAARWVNTGSAWTVENLGTFGESSSNALDINNPGQVLISATTGTTTNYHILNPDNTSIAVPGSPDGLTFPSKINDLGQVLMGPNFSGYLWDAVNGFTDTGLDSISDINNQGQAVGLLGGEVYLWSGGSLIEINSLIADPAVDVVAAKFINDQGVIFARGSSPSGPGLLLNPVPEPGTLAVMGALAPALLARRRRRR